MATGPDEIWRVGQKIDVHGTGEEIYKPEFFKTVEESIDALDKTLRELSLDISGLTEYCVMLP